MKSTGYVLKPRDYIGSAEPPATVLEDESRFGNDGAFLGDGEPDWIRLPSGLWVLRYDGSDDIIDCGTALSLSPAKITTMAWIKTSRASQDILHRYVGAGDQRAYDLFIDGTKLYLAANPDGESGSETLIASDTAVNGNVWTYVTATSDGSNLNLYVNGVVDATPVAFANDIHPSTGTLYIGKANYTGVEYLGDMALPKIRNYAMLGDSIAAIFQAERHWFGV